jgi:hypothetical protein
MQDEFDPVNYPVDMEFRIPQINDEGDPNEFEFEIELPYGTFEFVDCYYIKINDANREQKEIPKKEKEDSIIIFREPKPISAEQQRQLDTAEEEENKQREYEAKIAINKLKKQQEREAFEKKQQIIQQEQNTLKLDTFWKAMELTFYDNTEDANASLSILSIYYLTLTDHFSFYANLQPQFFTLKEN